MSKVLITGGHGFLGKAVTREFEKNAGWATAIDTFRSREYDLRDRDDIARLLKEKQPDTIVHLAAVVGGIGANQKYPGTFCYENLIMGTELIEQSRKYGVKKFVLVGTICSYPKYTPVPFLESDLWTGYPEETNAPYGMAKKMLTVLLDAYHQQYGFKGITLLPVNLYGPEDNFHLENSHVIPAMLRKFHIAKESDVDTVTLWGDGTPSREFLYVDDAARAIRLATEKYDSPEPVNLGSGSEITMKRLAQVCSEAVGYSGDIIWDTSRPNGQPRRCLDVTRAKERFGFQSNMTLPMGIQLTYDWFRDNYEGIQEAERAAETAEQATS